jgi:hypothetical protein
MKLHLERRSSRLELITMILAKMINLCRLIAGWIINIVAIGRDSVTSGKV